MTTSLHYAAFRTKQSAPAFRPRVEIRFTWLAILATLLVTLLAAYQLVCVFLDEWYAQNWVVVVAQVVFWVIIAFYIYGGLVYQLTRLSYLTRGLRHRRVSEEELDRLCHGDPPALTILVPSYKEEESVVFNTLMSVALQTYPNRRIVLLIDDPPQPGSGADRRTLAASRRLPGRVTQLLSAPAHQIRRAQSEFRLRQSQGLLNLRREVVVLASLHRQTAAWFADQARRCNRADHASVLYADSVLLWHREAQLQKARGLVASLQAPDPGVSAADLARKYEQLLSLFTVEVTRFERKRYDNLSHEANKAMNLNSYIGLVGKSFLERYAEGKLTLEETNNGDGSLTIPDADYLLTLDADSLVTPDYALRLIHVLEKPGNERIAVAQTPYNTIPGATSAIEQMAGATTDIQYIIHQGFTSHEATYWVGANAVLRKAALLDIALCDQERGHPITRFIQDRTVIEDTESSIDLVSCGWQLYNYPERLAFSATPPDFGSLIIQRRRWANGGLIILPKLLSLLGQAPLSFRLARQGFMRAHYLLSITAVNLGIVLWLLLPTGQSTRTLWLPLTALPYYLLYMRDLQLLGYRRKDVLRVYALNLLLIPVNLAGVFKSLQQVISGCKVPFGRTPKVQNRTAASAVYILAEYALVAYWLVLSVIELFQGSWLDGAFGLANASLLIYAVVRFVGFSESIEDLVLALPKPLTVQPSASERVPSEV